MKLNELTFVAQVKKGNMILTTYKNKNNQEFLFAKLVKQVVVPVTPVVDTVVSNTTDELIVPYFLTPAYVAKKRVINSIVNELLEMA